MAGFYLVVGEEERSGGGWKKGVVCWKAWSFWRGPPAAARVEKEVRMAASNSQIPGVRSHFKTPEGRYNLSHEKTHPTGLLHYNFGKVTTQVCDFCYPTPHVKSSPVDVRFL